MLSCFSHVRLFATPYTIACPGLSVHGILHARTVAWIAISFSRGSSRPRDQIWVCCIGRRVFSNESAFCIRWPKYRSFSFSINPSNEYSGLISLTIDYFDLLAIQRTFKSLLQDHNLKASILQPSLWSNSQIHT